MLSEEPSALNSNLLPVNAKGDVRLRSDVLPDFMKDTSDRYGLMYLS